MASLPLMSPTPGEGMWEDAETRLLLPDTGFPAIWENSATHITPWVSDPHHQVHYPLEIASPMGEAVNGSCDPVDADTTDALVPSDSLDVVAAQSQEIGPSKGGNIATRQAMAPPPPKPRKRKAPTLRKEDWEPVKHRVIELHIDQNLPLKDVKQIVEVEFEATGFTATIRQFKSRLSEWGLEKNIKTNEMKAIIRKRHHRKVVEKNKREFKFRVRGVEVPVEKIDRFMKRNGVLDGSMVSMSPDASTPSALSASTASDLGSPAASPVTTTIMGTMSRLPLNRPNINIPSPASSPLSEFASETNLFTGQSPTISHRMLQLEITNGSPSWSAAMRSEASIPHYYLGWEEDHARQELFAREALWGEGHPETIRAMVQLGDLLHLQGRYRSAEKLNKNLLARCLAHYGEEHVETIKAMSLFARVFVMQGLYSKGNGLHCKAAEIAKRVLGSNHLVTLMCLKHLGNTLIEINLFKEAEVILREVVTRAQRVYGPHHAETLDTLGNLGAALNGMGQHWEAEAMHRGALSLEEYWFGPYDHRVMFHRYNLAISLYLQGRQTEAEMILRPLLATKEKVIGREHPNTLDTVALLAFVLQMQHFKEEAAMLHQRALEGYRRVLGDDHPRTRKCQEDYLRVLSLEPQN